MSEDKGQKILTIATKRGFIYPTAEIYTTTAGFWTYGHLGTLMKRKWEDLWRDYFLNLNDNFFEIEGSYILPKAVFESSGHLKNFNDPLVSCSKCGYRARADDLIEDNINKNVEGLSLKELDATLKESKIVCPKCKNTTWGKAQYFNMMFDVKIGSLGNEIGYLSPETAQNPFLAYKRQIFALRERLPMGLAMLGRVFRNEISPRQGFYRLREFNQAELQIFFDPKKIDEVNNWSKVKNYKLRLALAKDKGKVKEITCEEANSKLKLPKMYLYYAAKMQQFYLKALKIPKTKFRFRELAEDERAFYNKIHFDAEGDLETLGGFKELGGLHYRGDHDLGGHQKGSKTKLELTDNGEKVLPHVLELSFGVDRNIWALFDMFFQDKKDRSFFSFPSVVSPFHTTVFPLVKKDKKLVKKSREVYDLLRKDFKTFYDESGSIGKRYRRAEEVGINSMITVDFDTLNDNTITLRSRDTMQQVRVPIDKLQEVLTKFLKGEKLYSLGKKV